MLFANVYGGLGNQLFGYAFARAVQEHIKAKKMFISRRYFLRQYREWDYRPEFFADYYQLCPSRVRICQDRVTEQEVRFLSGIYRRLFPEDSNILSSEQLKRRIQAGYICSRTAVSGLKSLDELDVKSKIVFVEGLFQWPEIFANIRPALKQELTLKCPLYESIQCFLKQIKSLQAVCMHVRRGDFLQIPGFQVCNYEYYAKGMKFVNEQVDNAHFFIFSDDVEWVKEHYPIPYPHTFIEGNHEAPLVLELMRNCKHFIISNSTFSWWGQYLCDYKDSVVVAPNPWFSDGRKVSLYLPQWHVIDVDV